ncbi:MAG: hypothetical protein ACHQAV_04145 [Solirubrobacterales bacterium]
MYLLYTDESGDVRNPADRALVVAGIAVHEDAVRPLAGGVNKMLGSFVGVETARTMEIHGSPMLRGRGEWKAIGVGSARHWRFGYST